MILTDEEDQTDPAAEAAQADGQDAEYADASTARGNQVGKGSLALRLQSTRLGVGTWPLEQMTQHEARTWKRSPGFFSIRTKSMQLYFTTSEPLPCQ